jgi:PIN domain nuclease of toxin-antitoxin system
MPAGAIRELIASLRLDLYDLGGDDALATGLLRPVTRSFGLSLGDRACLALAQRLRLPVVTADRAWANLALGVTIQLVR